MGKEIELKLSAPDAHTLSRVCADAAVTAAQSTPWQEISMQTHYLDTPDGAFAARRWMLRQRLENETPVFTMKTPGSGLARGEWSSEKTDLSEAMRELISLGAPHELQGLASSGLSHVCGVRFVRKTAQLCLPGARFWLCADSGHFLAQTREAPFYELELELIEGELSALCAFAAALQTRHTLCAESQSKFQRALALAKSCL